MLKKRKVQGSNAKKLKKSSSLIKLPTLNLSEVNSNTLKLERSSSLDIGLPSPRDLSNLKSFIVEHDFWDELYIPRTLTSLFIILGVTFYLAFLNTDETSGSIFRGLGLAAFMFLSYCGVQVRDGILSRPHPIVWRLVHGIGLIYLMILSFFLMQKTSDGRKFLKVFDNSLGEELPEKDYASDCRIFTPDACNKEGARIFCSFSPIIDVLLDEFVIAHLLGWIAKALLFRDWTLLWALSWLFEVLEVSLQHILENFNECWWDHIIIDIFVCNLTGMIIGMWINKKMSYSKFNWLGLSEIPTKIGKLERVVLQLTPYSWTTYHWDILGSMKKFYLSLFMVLLVEIIEINAFFLKYIFWIPPPHPINVARLLTWFALGLPALREYYDYQYGHVDATRLGQNAWLVLALLCMECMCVWKYSEGMFADRIYQTPAPVIVCWLLFILSVVIFSFTFVEKINKGHKTKTKDSDDESRNLEWDERAYTVQSKMWHIGGVHLKDLWAFLAMPLPLGFILIWDVYTKSRSLE